MRLSWTYLARTAWRRASRRAWCQEVGPHGFLLGTWRWMNYVTTARLWAKRTWAWCPRGEILK